MTRQHVIALLLGIAVMAGILTAALVLREPRHDGAPLSYWMANWHLERSSRVNAMAQDAVLEIGPKGLPYYIKWMNRPMKWSSDVNYPDWALHGFETLGPAAKSAIPDLIKCLGKSGNYPSLALAHIGKDAVPALTNYLATNSIPSLSPLSPRRPREMIGGRWAALETLRYMGTNAEGAVPFLVTYLERKDLGNFGPANPAKTLASVGRKQPNIVVPALIKALAASTGYARASVAQALGEFGADAKEAIAPLAAACEDADAFVRTRAGTALKRITPNESGTLTPLIQNLTNNTKLAREQAIWALDSLGTNALESLPALISTCLNDPADQVRSEAMQCFYSIGKCTDEVIAALVVNLSNTNYFMHGKAVNILAGFARESKPAFLELLKARGSPHKEVREQARNNVTTIVYYHQSFLVECFEHPDAEVRFRAFQTLAFDGGVDIPVARRAMTKALKDEDSRVRDIAKDTLSRWDANGIGIH